MIEITPVQSHELADLAGLAARSFTDAFGHRMHPEDLQKSLQANRSVEYFEKALAYSRVLVAKRDGKMVGYAQYGEVKIPGAPAGKNDRELGRLYVDTHAHGQGVGRRLMEAALADPEMQAAPQVFLEVWDQNTKALPLYESYGFTPVGVTHFTLGDGTPAKNLIMVRPRP